MARRPHGGHLRARRRDAAAGRGRGTDPAEATRRLEEAVGIGRARSTIRAGHRGPGRESGGGRRSRRSCRRPRRWRSSARRAAASSRAVEPRRIGRAITELGGGRRTVEDTVDPVRGLRDHRQAGRPVGRASRSRRFSRGTPRGSPAERRRSARRSSSVPRDGWHRSSLTASRHEVSRCWRGRCSAVRERTSWGAPCRGCGRHDVRRVAAPGTALSRAETPRGRPRHRSRGARGGRARSTGAGQPPSPRG